MARLPGQDILSIIDKYSQSEESERHEFKDSLQVIEVPTGFIKLAFM
jgi:hypothetical protein